MSKRSSPGRFISGASRVPNIQTSHAILLLGDKYVLQLRDNKPTIAAPGQWALFGGMKKTSETPLEAISREIQEELSIQPSEIHYLWFADHFAAFEGKIIRMWFFSSDVNSVWAEHKLLEGQSIGIFRFKNISGLEMQPIMRETIEHFHQCAYENHI